MDHSGRHFRRPGIPSGESCDQAQEAAQIRQTAAVPGIAPHDLSTCATLCRASGGELEQIQLLLGHSSVQTTERYLGTRQDLAHAPNDAIKLKLAG